MKPFWKNSRKKKTKNPSTPPQQKPRTRAKPKSMEEPWKPPMAVPPKAIGQERTPITQMLESARPVRKEYIPARPSTRKSEYYHEFRSNFQQLLSPKCRPIDIWRDFIVMVACAMSNTVDKAHYDEREKMCYIQISLLGVAGYIKVGNALTKPMTPGDSMENYWFTPMYFSDVWHTRRTIRTFIDLFKEDAT